MQRKFLFNLLLLVFINLLIKPLAIFGIDAEVQNRIGYQDYGIYFSLFNFTYLFNILLDVGLTNFNIKNVAQHPQLSRRYIGKFITLKFLLLLVYSILILSCGWLIGFNQKQFQILYFLILNQFLLSFLLFLRSYFSGMLLFAWDAFFSIFDKLILIVVAGYYLYVAPESEFNLYHFIFSQTFAYCLSITIAILLLAKKVGFSHFKIKANFSLAIFKRSLPYAFLILTMTMYTRIDAVLLERIHPNGAFQTGVYAQAYRILDAFVMFAMLFNTLLFPIFSTLLAKRENFIPLLVTSSKLMFTLAISVSIGSIAYSEEILSLFYHEVNLQAIETFQLLMLTFIPIASIQLIGTLHTAGGNLKFLNVVSCVGIAVNVILNYILIPKFGSIGTAITCLITHLVISITQLIYSKKHFRLFVNWKLILQLISFGILLLLTIFILKQFSYSFVANFCLFAFSAVVFSILLRLIDIKNILQLVNKRST